MEIIQQIEYKVLHGEFIFPWEKKWLMNEVDVQLLEKSGFKFEAFLLKIKHRLVNSILMRIITRCRPFLSKSSLDEFIAQIMRFPSSDDLEGAITFGYHVNAELMEKYFIQCKDEVAIYQGLCIAALYGIEFRKQNEEKKDQQFIPGVGYCS